MAPPSVILGHLWRVFQAIRARDAPEMEICFWVEQAGLWGEKFEL